MKQKSDEGCTNVETEAKVDVEDVAFGIDHDVSVVTVFELQEVSYDRVSGHARDEIVACLKSVLYQLLRTFWNLVLFGPLCSRIKYSYNPLTCSRPNMSREIEFGNTSITPH